MAKGKFQSTRPARGATMPSSLAICLTSISIHAPREGRDNKSNDISAARAISIHAPREGRDRELGLRGVPLKDFNPRAPRGARRYKNAEKGRQLVTFQSTRPARGATLFLAFQLPQIRFQSTRPARGATRRSKSRPDGSCYFNPRAPRGARQSEQYYQSETE